MTYGREVSSAPAPPLITMFSACSIGASRCPASGGQVPTSGTWSGAKRIVYVPFWLVEPYLVRKVFWHNGATVLGTYNIDCGVYNDTGAGLPGTKIVSSALTAQGSANVLQEVDVTDTWLLEGSYWLAFGCDTTSATFFCNQPAQVPQIRTLGIMTEDSAATPFVLPATATVTSGYSNNKIPVFGISNRTLVA
jgi:hypothetical protein